MGAAAGHRPDQVRGGGGAACDLCVLPPSQRQSTSNRNLTLTTLLSYYVPPSYHHRTTNVVCIWRAGTRQFSERSGCSSRWSRPVQRFERYIPQTKFKNHIYKFKKYVYVDLWRPESDKFHIVSFPRSRTRSVSERRRVPS